MTENTPASDIPLAIDDKLISRQDSFKSVTQENQQSILKASLELANNSLFQGIVRGTMGEVEGANNPREITEVLEKMRRDISGIQLANNIDGSGELEQLEDFFPNGAIDPAVDSFWETLKVNAQ